MGLVDKVQKIASGKYLPHKHHQHISIHQYEHMSMSEYHLIIKIPGSGFACKTALGACSVHLLHLLRRLLCNQPTAVH